MPNRVQFTDDQQAAIVQNYLDGATAQRLTHDYGTSAVVRVLREHGVFEPGRKFAGRYTPEQRAEIVRRYLAGETQNALAREFGCDRANIHAMLKRRGIEMRRGREYPLSDEDAERVRSGRARGLNFKSIAEEMGLPPHRVVQWARQMGISSFVAKRGPASPSWKGGRFLDHTGYILVLIDASDPYASMATRAMRIPEHRLVMARSLGRPLTSAETVHHINGIRDDNRLENLQLRTGNHGKGVVYICQSCGSHDVSPQKLANM